jgi:hypothetical protein
MDASLRRVAVAALVCAAAIPLSARWLGERHARATVRAPSEAAITPAVRAATFRFAADVTPADRAWILAAVAGARPEARRLIDEVDGRVEIATMPPGPLAIGLAELRPGRYIVRLDVTSLDGRRVIDRSTALLHELGHVVDYALLSQALRRRLDAGIPRTGSCGPPAIREPIGDCAAREERFADTFAKWALRGAVSVAGAGYGIPMPASLEDWGAPLEQLAAGLPAR